MGTSTPLENLHMHEAGATPNYLKLTNDDTGDSFTDGTKLGINRGGSTFLVNYEDRDIYFQTGGTTRAVLTRDGEFGIGTINPSSELEVFGTTQTLGLSMPTGAADGLVLTSDASGVASWQPGDDGDWTIVGDEMYAGVSGDVGRTTSASRPPRPEAAPATGRSWAPVRRDRPTYGTTKTETSSSARTGRTARP